MGEGSTPDAETPDVRAEFGLIHLPAPAMFLRKFVRHEGLANAGQGFQQES